MVDYKKAKEEALKEIEEEQLKDAKEQYKKKLRELQSAKQVVKNIEREIEDLSDKLFTKREDIKSNS